MIPGESRLPTSQGEYLAMVEKDNRRNLTVFAGFEFLWGLGMAFGMFAAFAPAYLEALHSPQWLIGLVLTFPAISASGQLIVSYLIPARWRLRGYVLAYLGGLLPWLLYSASSVVWGHFWPPWAHWVLFTLCMAIFIGATGAFTSLYWEIMTDNTPPDRRGRLFGWRTLGGGISGLAMSFVAIRVLQHWETPRNFRISFLIGIVLYTISCFVLLWVRDYLNPVHGQQTDQPRLPWIKYAVEAVRELWIDARYRRFLFCYILLMVGITHVPFMVAAAKRDLGATAQQQGLFVPIYLATVACSGWVIGWVADRYGYRLVGCLCGVLLAITFSLCLLTRDLFFWYLAFVAYASCPSIAAALQSNLSAELCPHIPLNRLLAAGNVLVVPLVVISSTVSGALVDFTGSYTPIFLGGLVISLAAVLGFIFVVREPRSPPLHLVKVIPKG